MTRKELLFARDTAGGKAINVFAEMNRSGRFKDQPFEEFKSLCELHALACRQMDQVYNDRFNGMDPLTDAMANLELWVMSHPEDASIVNAQIAVLEKLKVAAEGGAS